MQRFWVTIHWPHPVNPADEHEWFVYLQHQYKAKGEQVSPGDMVVFYETGKGKPHHRNGTSELVRLKKGRKAVIGIAEAAGHLRESTTGHKVREYEDGETLNWAWEVPCHQHGWGQDVQYEEVLEILDRGNMRIRSGLKEINRSQFEDFRKRLGL